MLGCTAVVVLALASVAAVNAQEPAHPAADTQLWQRLLVAEDARGRGDEGLAALREGRRAADAELRAWAVRALGRLESDSLLTDILASLDDPEPSVRAEAVNAAAQAVARGDPERARSALLERARRETDARVLGVVAESLGRLAAADSSAVHETAAMLLALSRMDSAHVGDRSSAERGEAGRGAQEDSVPDAPPVQLIGAVRGLYFLVRQPEASDALPGSVTRRLAELTAYEPEAAPDSAAADVAEVATDTTADITAGADRAAAAETETPSEGGGAGDAAARADTIAGVDAPRRGELNARRVRTVATATLVASGLASEEQLTAVLEDPDPYVRREAAAGATELDDRSAARRLAERALDDESGVVRYEGLRVLGRIADDADACERMRAAIRDTSAHVALFAIDLLGTPRCAIRPGVAQLLDREARTLPPAVQSAERTPAGASPTPGGWHRAAHAIVALAAADPARARRRLPAFVEHDDFFVRTYAARAAAALGDERTLRRLASDAHPNVRVEAIGGLRAYVGHGGDSLYIAQLERDDSQLLQAAADALAGSDDASAPATLLDALDRVTAARRETSRDARRAMLERIAEIGKPTHAGRLEPYLRDFDTEIAAQAASTIEAWTGSRPAVEPSEPPPTPLPALDELTELADARVIIEIEIAESADDSPDHGDTVELRLLPFVAPTNVARFVRLAREGYYDGLTFHRIVPNFVIQGGSPRANEYAGDGPYSRDELGLVGNWRGTVGLSTRGRDTGDAQLYVNLIDNIRLDHDYTVWGDVVAGMDVIDRMPEGAVIRKVTVQR